MEEEDAGQPDGISVNQTKPMSKAKYKHAMERLSDMAEGKEIEWNDCGEWKKDSEPWLQSVDHMNSPNLIRTKETPTKLPFGPEDIRPGMVFQVVGISGVSWRPPVSTYLASTAIRKGKS